MKIEERWPLYDEDTVSPKGSKRGIASQSEECVGWTKIRCELTSLLSPVKANYTTPFI
jgi:hypothetical protein